MKSTSLKIAAGSLVLGVATAAYGQASVPAVTTSTNAASTNGVAKAAVPSKPFVKLDGTDVAFAGLPPITFHGFASQGFLASTSYNFLAPNSTRGSFNYDEVGLNASMSPFPRTRIAAQAFAFDVGNVGYNETVLDYGMIDYNAGDAFGIRLGRIRRPEGIYNHIQDVDVARTSVLLPQGLYNARWRDFSASLDGGSFYGNLSLKKAGSLSYEAYGGMINLSQSGGVARAVESLLYGTGLTLDQVKGNPQVGGQLWWNTPVDGLRFGAAMTYNIGFTFDASENTLYPVGGGHFTALDVMRHTRMNVPWHHYSVEYVHNKWTFQGEFRTQTLIEKDTTSVDFPAIPTHDSTTVGNSMSTSASWYVGASYEVNPWFQIGTYYNEYYGDLNHIPGPSTSYQKDLALSFRFDPKPWWTLKLEGHYMRGTGLLDDNIDNPVQTDQPWYMVAMKTTFNF